MAARAGRWCGRRGPGCCGCKVAIGDEIAEGQEVAEICNVFGEVVEQWATSGAGIAGLVWSHKVVNTGDPIVRYWIVDVRSVPPDPNAYQPLTNAYQRLPTLTNAYQRLPPFNAVDGVDDNNVFCSLGPFHVVLFLTRPGSTPLTPLTVSFLRR